MKFKIIIENFMETLVTFVRHGKNSFAKEGTAWHPGPKLNKEGIEQSEKTGRYLARFPFDIIISSDMNRTRQTAEIINKYQKKNKNKTFANISFYRELAEHDKIIYESNPKQKAKFREEILKAEVTVEFFKRFLKENKGKKILVVGHGNMTRACIGTSLGYHLKKCPELNLLNCSVSSVAYHSDKLRGLFYLNSVEHYKTLNFKSKFISVQFLSDYSVPVEARKKKIKTNLKVQLKSKKKK